MWILAAFVASHRQCCCHRVSHGANPTPKPLSIPMAAKQRPVRCSIPPATHLPCGLPRPLAMGRLAPTATNSSTTTQIKEPPCRVDYVDVGIYADRVRVPPAVFDLFVWLYMLFSC